jgi:NADP-dependent 3-hydroxy acid dehydrogenase YdfG
MTSRAICGAGAARVYTARKVDQIEGNQAEFGDQVIGLPCDLKHRRWRLSSSRKSPSASIDILRQ